MSRFLQKPLAIQGILSMCLMANVVWSGEIRFAHHFIESWEQPDGGSWGQTGFADMDGDGDRDFVMARRNGHVLCYEYLAANRWVKHKIGDKSPSEVGAVLLDVDGDTNTDVVLGGAWLKNPGGKLGKPWPRHTFDPDLRAVHDVIAADVDGDGKLEVVTMSDRNDVRWYDIPADPTKSWPRTVIGKPVHAGLAAGDLDGDGDVDIVRSTSWFENREKGRKWVEHRLHAEPWPDVEGVFHDSTRSAVVDINGDGRRDVVLTIAEVVGAKVAWMEPPADPRSGPWKMHVLPQSDDKRAPYHSLAVADFDNDGDPDIFSGEMESIRGAKPARWFIWENVSGKGAFVEHVILDKNLGTHEVVAADVDGDGDVDLAGKPWRAWRGNATDGRLHVDYLENLLKSAK